VKFQTTARFLRDYARLSKRDQALFAAAVRQVNEAYDASKGEWPPAWPSALRIKPVQSAAGIWEMTWSFSGPDGRATLEFIAIEGEPAIRWRRIGGHEVFRQP
jgi:hypothetical protein